MSSYLSLSVLFTLAGCRNPAMIAISTKSAFEQFIYTVYVQQMMSKLQLLQNIVRPVAFEQCTLTTNPLHQHVPFKIIWPSNPKLVHSFSNTLYFTDFTFLVFLCIFHLFCLIHVSLSLLPKVIAFSLSHVSFIWIGKESEKVGLYTTGMCHSCIACAT